jgi:hypothetical protein
MKSTNFLIRLSGVRCVSGVCEGRYLGGALQRGTECMCKWDVAQGHSDQAALILADLIELCIYNVRAE